MKTVLVLGSTGFIGGHIAKAALKAGWKVRGFRRAENQTGHVGGLPVKWFRGDLMDSLSLTTAMKGVDIVFHAAAFYPKDGNPKNISHQIDYAQTEIKNVIETAKLTKVNRFIYTSTLTTIGHPPPQENRLADEQDFYTPGTLPKSGYYEAKIQMEQFVLDAATKGLPAVVLNPTAVFGPGDVNLTMGGILIAVNRGWMLGWLPGKINVVDVRDVATAHIAAAKHGRIGERYIIGGHNFTVREALNLAAQACGKHPPRIEIPIWLLKSLAAIGDVFPFLPLPSNHLRAVHLWQGYNTKKAEQEFAFSPRLFGETVRDSLDWFDTWLG